MSPRHTLLTSSLPRRKRRSPRLLTARIIPRLSCGPTTHVSSPWHLLLSCLDVPTFSKGAHSS